MNNRSTIFNGTKARIKSKLNMDCCLLDKLDFVVSLINSRELFARAWFCFAVNFWNRLTSSVISRPTCFSSSLRCCWQVGSPPFVRRRCDCLASSAPFANAKYSDLLTYFLSNQKRIISSISIGWNRLRVGKKRSTFF